MMSIISQGDVSWPFMDILQDCGMITLRDNEITEEHLQRYFKIHVNGAWVGVVRNGFTLAKHMRMKRRTMEINEETEIAINYDNKLIRINTDSGRSMRPLFVVEEGKLKITQERIDSLSGVSQPILEDGWNRLLAEGLIEYIGGEEEENCLVAMFPKDIQKDHTHCEIHPGTMFGTMASTIPFAHHNPPARNTFQW
jgi:DNA-directed RNA polymerase beta subunit